MKLEHVGNLDELAAEIERFNLQKYPDSKLRPIVGGGEKNEPVIMFVFINPTKRNIASDPMWKGLRVPWVGISSMWEVFNRAEIIDSQLTQEIKSSKKYWSTDFTSKVYDYLSSKELYLTNIVKWAGEDAKLPEKTKIKNYLPFLLKEIELVKPRHIVCFGTIPFFGLTNISIKMEEFHTHIQENNNVLWNNFAVGDHECKITACYFPVGMGRFNQPKAIEILKKVNLELL